MKLTQHKKDLELFKFSYIDNFLIPGQLYRFTNDKILYTHIENNKPILILKIEIVDSLTYFNIGPSIIITILQDNKKEQIFINNRHLLMKDYIKDFKSMFVPISI